MPTWQPSVAATAAVRDHVRSQSGDDPTAVEDIVLTQDHFEYALADLAVNRE